MAICAEIAGRRAYRLGRVAVFALLVGLMAGALCVVVFDPWRPWEGSRPQLEGVSQWQALTDPVPSSLDGGPVALLPSTTPVDPTGRRIVVGFLGAGCTAAPWRVAASYTLASITVEVDPDPRGCRGSDEGLRRHAFRVDLDEAPVARPVAVVCVASDLCRGIQGA
jgi:hypothetical protein